MATHGKSLFHLSIAVDDLARAKAFYLEALGCTAGRETKGRFDINFFGHHVVAHHAPREAGRAPGAIESDGDVAPLRHFGVILPLDDWRVMEQRLKDQDIEFTLSPRLSFAGKPAEQHIMMLPDGCGNVIEFKSQPRERVFATDAP
jgi:extradiol dioxygenase family protein